MSELQPTRKLVNILYASAHGRLPWGIEWDRDLPYCTDLIDDETGAGYEGYVLCCGHTLRYPDESSAVVGAGLMLPGPKDRFGRPTLTITKVGREYLMRHIDLAEIDEETISNEEKKAS